MPGGELALSASVASVSTSRSRSWSDELDRRREALARRGGGLVAERRGCREVGLDRLNVPFDVHVTSI